MTPYLEKRASELSAFTRVRLVDAIGRLFQRGVSHCRCSSQCVEDLSFIASNSIHVILVSHVLCSVRLVDVDAVLGELRRVLVVGGAVGFIEHVADANNATLRHGLQSHLTPLWRVIGDGCGLDRDTAANIRRVFGARHTSLEYVEVSSLPALLKPHVVGKAVKSASELN
jgi:hypothetical protein